MFQVARGDIGLLDHGLVFAGCLRACLIALWLVGWSDETSDYPAYGRAVSYDKEWMLPILIRNLIGTWVICGGWDYILYLSPLKDKFKAYKMNPEYPPFAQISHDAFYTTVSSVIAALLEIVLCHYWATGTHL